MWAADSLLLSQAGLRACAAAISVVTKGLQHDPTSIGTRTGSGHRRIAVHHSQSRFQHRRAAGTGTTDRGLGRVAANPGPAYLALVSAASRTPSGLTFTIRPVPILTPLVSGLGDG